MQTELNQTPKHNLPPARHSIVSCFKYTQNSVKRTNSSVTASEARLQKQVHSANAPQGDRSAEAAILFINYTYLKNMPRRTL